MIRIVASLICCGMFLTACTHPDDLKPADYANSLELTDMASRISAAKYVFIGEKHDNPEHHKVQQAILEKYLKPGDVVVFEMLKEKQQSKIDKYLAGDLPFEDLEHKLKWEKSGWPEWGFYAPLFKAAKESGAKIVHGSLSRNKLKAYTADITELPEGAQIKLDEDIRVGHCNLLPEKVVPAIAKTQIKKDAYMAKQLASVSKGNRAFLIAGNGHVLRDRAVPYHLKVSKIDQIFVIGLAENGNEPDQFNLHQSYDVVWATKGVGKTQEDYCEGLRKKFGKK